jgi:hypothetical protein
MDVPSQAPIHDRWELPRQMTNAHYGFTPVTPTL